jgi:fatty acid synthase subunit alpha, fungi type
MAQKSLLGHSKGGSAAWQLIGVLQTIITGIVPGNRNCEYVASSKHVKHTAHHFPAILTLHSKSIIT